MGDPLGRERTGGKAGAEPDDTASQAGSASRAVVVPIKAFNRAKARLAGVLEPAQREELAKKMAQIVILAARPYPVIVACDDEAVAAWAVRHGARVSWTEGLDLDGAATTAVAESATWGYAAVAVVHADLPLAQGVSHLFDFGGVTLVPDRAGGGTNACCLPTDIPFRFSYGDGSLRRHHLEALRHHRGVRIVRDPRLGHDIDIAADLADIPELMGVVPGR